MTSLSSTSALTSSLALTGRNKVPTRDEIFAAQNEKEAQKATENEAVKSEFLRFAKMSPAERIRASYLKDHNLTEDSLAQLSKEDQMKIEEEIKNLIKMKLGDGNEKNQMGQITNVIA